MGSIIAVVAVLETNALNTAVTSMNPPIMFTGLLPTSLSVISAMRRSNPHRCIDSAMRNPPMNRKMYSLA